MLVLHSSNLVPYRFFAGHHRSVLHARLVNLGIITKIAVAPTNVYPIIGARDLGLSHPSGAKTVGQLPVRRQDNDSKTLAQLPRRGSGMPLPHRGYPQPESYRSRWMDRGSAGHAVIGAAIGFTLGAILGAKANKNPQPGTTAGVVVIFGGFGALIGGFIGGAHAGSYPFAHQRGIYPRTVEQINATKL